MVVSQVRLMDCLAMRSLFRMEHTIILVFCTQLSVIASVLCVLRLPLCLDNREKCVGDICVQMCVCIESTATMTSLDSRTDGATLDGTFQSMD